MAGGLKHTVKYGDTLSEIVYYYNVTYNMHLTVDLLVKWNKIANKDFIVCGQVLYLYDPGSDSGGSSSSTRPVVYSTVTINQFGLLSVSSNARELYATWSWTMSKTKGYKVRWEYYVTESKVWLLGSETEVKEKQCTWSAPEYADTVRFKVIPVAETGTTNKTTTVDWNPKWSTVKTYSFTSNPPATPGTPSVKIEKYKLTAEVTGLDTAAKYVFFEIVKNDSKVVYRGIVKTSTHSATYTCNIEAGAKYKVRCRAQKTDKTSLDPYDQSDFSAYSSNVDAMPSVPSGITTCKATSKTSVYLEWSSVATAKTYDIEYSTKKEYFDNTQQTNKVNAIEFTHFEMVGLETGYEYFFRVRAVGSDGSPSGWSGIVSIIIGKDPVAPTTWSSTTTVMVGEPLILYWIHNAQDGSSQTYADLEVYVGGVKQLIEPIKNSTDDDEKDKTSTYSIDTSGYTEGTKIEWRVRTAGITLSYGEWSVKRTIDVYAPPTLDYSVTNKAGADLDILEAFPFYVSALPGPNTQKPIGYYLTVTSNDIYETVDRIGNPKIVNAGEKVYSRFFDITDPLLVELSANNIDLENNCSYTITCVASMDSGLTAEASKDIVVAWANIQHEPNAELGVNTDNYTAMIRPYCVDANNTPVENVMLSVYRREFDGSFTELMTDIPNGSNEWITDPHPSLDYARYRIVAISTVNGDVSYCDLPAYPVGAKTAIIQWDEDWTTFDVTSGNTMAQPTWAGSMLKLPYNIDISDSHKSDVSLVEYIGRQHPVSYYGTQLGESSNWSMDIDREDKETLYALRRLAKWMGDVYVREPSGSGYWANVTVSFSQKHCDVIIPVSLSITRVEGGV